MFYIIFFDATLFVMIFVSVIAFWVVTKGQTEQQTSFTANHAVQKLPGKDLLK